MEPWTNYSINTTIISCNIVILYQIPNKTNNNISGYLASQLAWLGSFINKFINTFFIIALLLYYKYLYILYNNKLCFKTDSIYVYIVRYKKHLVRT